MEREEALARLREARVGRLATVTPEGRPHVVPFVFALVERDGELTVYWAVDRKPKRTERIRRLDNIQANPRVELVVDAYEEDWSRLWWVRAQGSAQVVDDAAERAEALAALAHKYPSYGGTPPRGAVVAIRVERVSGWAAAAPPTGLETEA